MRSLAFVIAWTIVVLYPNPTMIVVSIERAWSPPVDATAVREIAATLPDDPRAIEAAVNTTLVSYAVPWQTYGVPWYFPSVDDVLVRGQGDCQARALVLASILRAKGIPARFVGSFDHLWVDYPGKIPTPLENPSVALVRQTSGGTYRLRWPSVVDLHQSWEIERAYFIDAMPPARLALLFASWSVVLWSCRVCFRPLRFIAVKRIVHHP